MARANKHFLVNLFRGKLTLVQPACGSFLSSFVRDIAESSCLFVFRQRFSAKIIYLSTVPSIDSPARGGGELVFPALSQTLARLNLEAGTKGSSSVRNIIHCARPIVFTSACVSKWNGTPLPQKEWDPPSPSSSLSLCCSFK